MNMKNNGSRIAGATIDDLDAYMTALGLLGFHDESVEVKWELDRPLLPSEVREMLANNREHPMTVDISCRAETLLAAQRQCHLQATSFAAVASALRMNSPRPLDSLNNAMGSGVHEVRDILALTARLVPLCTGPDEIADMHREQRDLADLFDAAAAVCARMELALKAYRMKTFGKRLATVIEEVTRAHPSPDKGPQEGKAKIRAVT